MANSDINNKIQLGNRYINRINSLGKCLVLWAKQDPDISFRKCWDETQTDEEDLMALLTQMANHAAEYDPKAVEFWRQVESILERAYIV